jgi:hypothetical protein
VLLIVFVIQGMKRAQSSRSLSGPAVCLAWANKLIAPFGLSVVDFTASWADGRAMCAIVSTAFPDVLNMSMVKVGGEADRRANFELAFEVARKHGGWFF